jgi:tRNA(Ile)-lysidine synthase
MKLAQAIKKNVIKYNMISAGDHVLIGLSGGPDSVSLTIILNQIKTELDLNLSALYVNHGLRPDEAGQELVFCSKFCKEQGIILHSKDVDVHKLMEEKKLNLHEAARELRYTAFEDVSDEIKADKIALGHNADDQAETVLMRIMRGSGSKGMSGIPPKRGRIIRPLIETERVDIEQFLDKDVSQSFMIDSSNLKDGYLRNWLRLNIMDELRKKDPGIVGEICRTADILREEDNYLEVIVTKTLMKLISRKSESSIELFLFPLETIELPVLRRLLRRAIDAVTGLKGITFVHIENMIALIKKGGAGDRIDLHGEIRAIKEYAVLKITSEHPVTIAEYKLAPSAEVVMKEISSVLKAVMEPSTDAGAVCDGKSSVFLDAGNMQFPLIVRSRDAGDFFYPFGFGKKKKIQDFFVDEKVPRDKRDRVPIVLSGNDIIWVAGFRADERFRTTESTEKFIRLTITKSHSK